MKLRPLAQILILFVTLFTATLVAAQQTELRSIFADVLDKKSEAPVESLTAVNFASLLDGKAVRVISAGRVRLKPHVGILLDASGSMGQVEKWNLAIDLVAAVTRSLFNDAQVSIVTFSDRIRPPQITEATDKTVASIESFRMLPSSKPVAKGRTALWDAMTIAIHAENLQSGDAIVLVTDGGDNNSKHKESEISDLLQARCIRVFSVLLPSRQLAGETDGVVNLERLAQATGGALLRMGGEIEGIDQTVFRVSKEELKMVPQIGEHLAQRIIAPYRIDLELPGDAKGKLRLLVVDAAGAPAKNVNIFAPANVVAQP
jgi:hypothetical protein